MVHVAGDSNSVANVYVRCDELDAIPEPNRLNYLAELELLSRVLSPNASVLQVGSMDGQRLIRLEERRRDLNLVGLEIDSELVERARRNTAAARSSAEFVCGDITAPPELPQFDYVICLNNTLGYIAHQEVAITEMRKLGATVVVSVYGEGFDDELAVAYFGSLGVSVASIESNVISVNSLGPVKWYTKAEVERWSGDVTETPIGYLVTLSD